LEACDARRNSRRRKAATLDLLLTAGLRLDCISDQGGCRRKSAAFCRVPAFTKKLPAKYGGEKSPGVSPYPSTGFIYRAENRFSWLIGNRFRRVFVRSPPWHTIALTPIQPDVETILTVHALSPGDLPAPLAQRRTHPVASFRNHGFRQAFHQLIGVLAAKWGP